MKRSALTLILVVFTSLVFLSVDALGGPPGHRGAPPPLVRVKPVTLQDVNPPREYVGHVQAIQTVDIQPRVRGYLEEVRFKEGDTVTQGDILYKIEQAPYAADVEAERARVEKAKATLYRATQHLKRLKAARRESVPATDMDNAVAAEREAGARLEEARALLKTALINLDYTIIKAPITGRIGRTAFTKGNLVGPETGPMARIVQMDPIRVVYSVSENELPVIQAAMKDASSLEKTPILVPRIRLPNANTYPHDGQVDFVDNEVDPKTGTIAIWAVFPNPKGILVPGMYVTVLVRKSKPKLMNVVP